MAKTFNRTERLQVRLSEEEKATLEHNANQAGISVTEYIRLKAIQAIDSPQSDPSLGNADMLVIKCLPSLKQVVLDAATSRKNVVDVLMDEMTTVPSQAMKEREVTKEDMKFAEIILKQLPSSKELIDEALNSGKSLKGVIIGHLRKTSIDEKQLKFKF